MSFIKIFVRLLERFEELERLEMFKIFEVLEPFELLELIHGRRCIYAMPIVVKRKKGESIHDMLNRFYQLMKQTNIIEDIREKQEFVKPSQKRYEKKKALEKSN